MTDALRDVTVVTGASSGIGEALAKRFAADGRSLVLVARNPGPLEALARALRREHEVEVKVIALDLGSPDAGESLERACERAGARVDTLVNNAGFGLMGNFAELDRAEQLALVDLNVRAATELTHRFVHPMVARGRGAILNVASTAAFQPGPGMAVYYASKSYLLSFTEALAHELTGSGVKVSALCPGPTITNFQVRANMVGARLVTMIPTTTASAVANAGYTGLQRGRRVIIPGVANSVLARGAAFFPSWVKLPLVNFLQNRK